LARGLALIAITLMMLATQASKGAGPELAFDELPPLPDPIGFAGPFAGVSGDRLIVAGGTNFPGKPIWDGGTKVWYDDVFVLDDPKGRWKKLPTKLPRPLGYGVSISSTEGLICIGGSDSKRHYADVTILRLDGDKLESHALPSLPARRAMMSGELIGRTIYLAGGIETPESTAAAHSFWALDLDHLDAGWQLLETWPGPERHCALAGATDDSFYLASGIALHPGPDGKAAQTLPYLSDAYRYQLASSSNGGSRADHETKGNANSTAAHGTWHKIADLPRALAAAASPMMRIDHELLVFSGIDHTGLGIDPRKYPPFQRDIFALDTRSGTWSLRGQMPEGSTRVTAAATSWRGGYVIAGGETGPSRRSPKVFWVHAARPAVR